MLDEVLTRKGFTSFFLIILYHMDTFFSYMSDMLSNKAIRTKLLWTLGILALYRMLVFVPVPFVDVAVLVNRTLQS